MIVHGYYYNTDTEGKVCDVQSTFFVPRWFESVTKGYTTISFTRESLNHFPRKFFPDDCLLHITSDVMPDYEEYFINENQLWDYLLMVEKYVTLYKKSVTVYVLISCPEKNWDVHYTVLIPVANGLKTAERTQKRVEMER